MSLADFLVLSKDSASLLAAGEGTDSTFGVILRFKNGLLLRLMTSASVALRALGFYQVNPANHLK
jgi:hypothetical protein